ncbi:MAG: hypothetical protein E7084_00950 [Bacteroidales bacterium]|nr:hypothetical protein [Bacteroidales bacterium]
MEIKKKKTESAEASNFNKIVENLFSAVETKEGTFYNLINNLFEAIKCLGSIQSPIVTMNCSKKFLSYKFSFDIVYVNSDGVPYRKNEFYTDSLLGGLVGVIPHYIEEAVKQDGMAEICFNANDLDTLFNELEVDIVESKEWSDLECECTTNQCASIKFIDRVFYTRVEYYDGNDTQMGVTHIALLKGLPTTISSKLYPLGDAKYVLQL